MTECTSNFQGMRFLVGNASYQNAASVSPADDTDLEKTASALWVGSQGAIKVDMEGIGVGITFAAVPVGLFRARITKVYANGTSASNLVALW